MIKHQLYCNVIAQNDMGHCMPMLNFHNNNVFLNNFETIKTDIINLFCEQISRNITSVIENGIRIFIPKNNDSKIHVLEYSNVKVIINIDWTKV